MSPPSGSAPDLLARHVGMRAAESYQRTQTGGNMRVAVSELSGRTGELVQGGLFKAPMPPQHQPQLEVFGSSGGGRRDLSRPTDLNFGLPQSQDPAFPSSPLSGLGSPHRSPYAQAPGTPRPDYSQQITDPFMQQSPPYVNPQTPGTPRSDPTYLATPPALRLDQYTQQSASRRPSPSHQNIDPYSSNPGTPRPSVTERFPRSPGSQRSSEAHAQQPSTLWPQKAPEAFSQAPVESFTPQSAGSGSSPLAPGETVAFTPTHHQVTDDTVLVCLCAVGFHSFILSSVAAVSRKTTTTAGLISQNPQQPDPKASWDVGGERLLWLGRSDSGSRPLRAGSYDSRPLTDREDSYQ